MPRKRTDTMDKKPEQILYGIEEKPPLRHLAALSLQHALIPLMFLTFPILVARELALSFADAVDYLSTCLLTLGLGTMLQCSRSAIGSGTLAVHQSSPIYLPAFLLAAKTGGLGAACFLALCAGILQIGLSRILVYLQRIFSEDVCGVAIFMLGVSLVPAATKAFFGFDHQASPIAPAHALIAGATLSCIVLISAFSRKSLKFYSLLIGCACGYLLAGLLHEFPPEAKNHLLLSPWVSLPHIRFPHITLLPDLLVVFSICAIISSIDAMGVMITVDKMNRTDWKRQDVRLSARGVQASGLNNALSGLLGAYPNGISSSNIGLSFATAVTSRYVGIGAGAIIALLAFFPKLLAILSIVPRPVIGAILMYASAFLICAGIDLIMLKSLNTRKIFIVGFSIIGGIACVDIAPFTERLPSWLQLVFRSQLTVATLLAIGLNLFFRIGRGHRMRKVFAAHAACDARQLIESFQAQVSLKREVSDAAYKGLNECLEAILLLHAGKPMFREIACSYRDAVLRLDIRYPGLPLDIRRQHPVIHELDDTENAVQLAVLLTAHYASRMEVASDKGCSTVSLFFEE